MSMNYYAVFGFYIKMNNLILKLSEESQNEWNGFDQEGMCAHEVIDTITESNNPIYKDLKRVFGNNWNLVFFDEDCMDMAGSEFVEDGELYIGLDYEELYDIKPNTLMNKLNEMGVEPVFDTACAFG